MGLQHTLPLKQYLNPSLHHRYQQSLQGIIVAIATSILSLKSLHPRKMRPNRETQPPLRLALHYLLYPLAIPLPPVYRPVLALKFNKRAYRRGDKGFLQRMAGDESQNGGCLLGRLRPLPSHRHLAQCINHRLSPMVVPVKSLHMVLLPGEKPHGNEIKTGES